MTPPEPTPLPDAPAAPPRGAAGRAAEVVEIGSRESITRPEVRALALETLEAGGVLFFPRLGFALTEGERQLIATARFTSLRESDNRNGRPTILFDPMSQRIEHARVRGAERRELAAMLGRFGEWARDLIVQLVPSYASALETDRVTFRPCERSVPQPLHVDSSYGHPTRGRGMLRVFCNIDPAARPRIWQIGEPFEPFATRFLPSVHVDSTRTWTARLLERLGVAKRQRDAYDEVIAALRRSAKGDGDYQTGSPHRQMVFPPGSTWIAITDLLLHAAISGQHSLDQTFYLPPAAMRDPSRSSLRILERLTGRRLV